MASRIQRPDRRAETEIRALSCRQGFLKQADGSAQFSAGGRSTVICGVYGPAEARVYDERLDSAFVEVRYRPDIGVPQTGDTWNREWLRELFERVIMCHLHPRTLVQLNFQVVQNDGSLDSVAINAGMLALIDAGIPVRHTVAAATCCIDKSDCVRMDPTQEEIEQARSIHTFAFSNVEADQDTPIYNSSSGDFTLEEYELCFDKCKSACQKTMAFIKTAVESRVLRLNQA